MTPTHKTGDTHTRTGLFRVAIVGAGTLKGKELKDLLSERNFPTADVRLLDDEESLGQLDSIGDEPAFIQSVMPEHLEAVDFTFFGSDSAYTATTWKLARDAGSEIIDLSYALDSNPEAALRAPWIDRELGRDHSQELSTKPVSVAHPAAVALALLFLRLKKQRAIVHANATVFEPASERGKRGMDELHDQTVNLLSFQQMPTAVFGTQVAFNVISGYGEGTQPAMSAVEERIVRHFTSLMGDGAPVPSLMLLQAPVFHAHTFSVYIELDSPMSVGDFEAALSGEHVQVMRADERPSNVNVAGSAEIQVAVRADAQRPTGFWLWAAADNLRIIASLAVECAEEMLSTRPRGQVQ